MLFYYNSLNTVTTNRMHITENISSDLDEFLDQKGYFMDNDLFRAYVGGMWLPWTTSSTFQKRRGGKLYKVITIFSPNFHKSGYEVEISKKIIFQK